LTNEKEIILAVTRFNPESDLKPHILEYSFPFEKVTSLLHLLKKINEKDGLVFRYSCDGFSGFCGLCKVMVNGKPALACKTLIDKPGRLEIEPLRNCKVLRDLAVEIPNQG